MHPAEMHGCRGSSFIRLLLIGPDNMAASLSWPSWNTDAHKSIHYDEALFQFVDLVDSCSFDTLTIEFIATVNGPEYISI